MISCSPDKNSDLFFAALGGLGRFGVITRARIAFEPAPKRVLWVRLAYADVQSFTGDQELLISKRSAGDSGGFDYIEGQVQLNRILTEGRMSSSFFSALELHQFAKNNPLGFLVAKRKIYTPSQRKCHFSFNVKSNHL